MKNSDKLSPHQPQENILIELNKYYRFFSHNFKLNNDPYTQTDFYQSLLDASGYTKFVKKLIPRLKQIESDEFIEFVECLYAYKRKSTPKSLDKLSTLVKSLNTKFASKESFSIYIKSLRTYIAGIFEREDPFCIFNSNILINEIVNELINYGLRPEYIVENSYLSHFLHSSTILEQIKKLDPEWIENFESKAIYEVNIHEIIHIFLLKGYYPEIIDILMPWIQSTQEQLSAESRETQARKAETFIQFISVNSKELVKLILDNIDSLFQNEFKGKYLFELAMNAFSRGNFEICKLFLEDKVWSLFNNEEKQFLINVVILRADDDNLYHLIEYMMRSTSIEFWALYTSIAEDTCYIKASCHHFQVHFAEENFQAVTKRLEKYLTKILEFIFEDLSQISDKAQYVQETIIIIARITKNFTKTKIMQLIKTNIEQLKEYVEKGYFENIPYSIDKHTSQFIHNIKIAAKETRTSEVVTDGNSETAEIALMLRKNEHKQMTNKKKKAVQEGSEISLKMSAVIEAQKDDSPDDNIAAVTLDDHGDDGNDFSGGKRSAVSLLKEAAVAAEDTLAIEQAAEQTLLYSTTKESPNLYESSVSSSGKQSGKNKKHKVKNANKALEESSKVSSKMPDKVAEKQLTQRTAPLSKPSVSSWASVVKGTFIPKSFKPEPIESLQATELEDLPMVERKAAVDTKMTDDNSLPSLVSVAAESTSTLIENFLGIEIGIVDTTATTILNSISQQRIEATESTPAEKPTMAETESNSSPQLVIKAAGQNSAEEIPVVTVKPGIDVEEYELSEIDEVVDNAIQNQDYADIPNQEAQTHLLVTPSYPQQFFCQPIYFDFVNTIIHSQWLMSSSNQIIYHLAFFKPDYTFHADHYIDFGSMTPINIDQQQLANFIPILFTSHKVMIPESKTSNFVLQSETSVFMITEFKEHLPFLTYKMSIIQNTYTGLSNILIHNLFTMRGNPSVIIDTPIKQTEYIDEESSQMENMKIMILSNKMILLQQINIAIKGLLNLVYNNKILLQL